MGCPFCDWQSEEMKKRAFYRDKNWFAILAAPFHTRGHTILAAIPIGTGCPQEPSLPVLEGLSLALVKTIEALKTVYQPKDVLLTSLRGSEDRFHFHLMPLQKDEEEKWRNSHADPELHCKGHFMEFLGYLEERGDRLAETEREYRCWSKEEQRTNMIASQKDDIEKLRITSGYYE
jgi:diadenosine tetraphosphate (Ap4A) HIT family hydrolase